MSFTTCTSCGQCVSDYTLHNCPTLARGNLGHFGQQQSTIPCPNCGDLVPKDYEHRCSMGRNTDFSFKHGFPDTLCDKDCNPMKPEEVKKEEPAVGQIWWVHINNDNELRPLQIRFLSNKVVEFQTDRGMMRVGYPKSRVRFIERVEKEFEDAQQR